VLLFWAEDDPIVPFYRSAEIKEHLHLTKLVSFGKVLGIDVPEWMAHCAENIRIEQFQEEFRNFIHTKFEDKISSSG
jgi:hypothetical protein